MPFWLLALWFPVEFNPIGGTPAVAGGKTEEKAVGDLSFLVPSLPPSQ